MKQSLFALITISFFILSHSTFACEFTMAPEVKKIQNHTISCNEKSFCYYSWIIEKNNNDSYNDTMFLQTNNDQFSRKKTRAQKCITERGACTIPPDKNIGVAESCFCIIDDKKYYGLGL